MKLFKILLTHVAPKDHETAIKEYIIAETHKDVFDYLYNADYTYWKDKEWTHEEKTTVLFGHGESALDNDWADAYYGITEYSWEQVVEDLTDNDINVLRDLEIATLV